MAIKKILCVTTCSVLLSFAAHAANDKTESSSAPDNTEVNERDRTSNAITADEAGNTTSDVKIMQQIRKAVVADDTLSTYGHNVKIISEGGKVTLKGPVKSEDERNSIESMATRIAGQGNVKSELSVSY